MRPVHKPQPTQPFAAAATPQDALTVLRMQLQDTIGYYCSFCEMPITVTQAVTSKRLRQLKRIPTRQDWPDLLLACDFCQLHRTSDVTDLRSYLWPDTDATFSLGATSPFVYALKDVNYVVKEQQPPAEPATSSTRPMVIVSANASSPEVTRAQRTVDLFQLNTPFYDARTNTFTITADALQSGIDLRVEKRTAAWEIAAIAIETLREAQALRDYPFCFENVGKLAAGLSQRNGFWSVWMTRLWQVFPDEKFIRNNLLETTTRKGYQVIGYQTEPDGGTPPWTIFTGTAVDRVTF